MAKKIPGRFVPLSVDAYIELSDLHPMAELLYYRMLQWAKKHPQTEGVVPDHEARGALARGMKASIRLNDLNNGGRIVARSGGWFIRVWYDFNPTKTEVTERQQAQRAGAHIANHKQGRHKVKVAGCPRCYRSSDQSSGRYSDQSTGSLERRRAESISSLRELRDPLRDAPEGASSEDPNLKPTPGVAWDAMEGSEHWDGWRLHCVTIGRPEGTHDVGTPAFWDYWRWHADLVGVEPPAAGES